MQIEELFISILNMSITASYAILAVIVLRLFFMKASRWITCVLWAIASFRLIFPFSLKSVLSVFSIIPSSDTIKPEIIFSETPTIHSGIPAVNSAVNPAISEGISTAADTSMSPIQVIAYIAGIIWLVGVVALIVYSVLSYIKLRRKTMDATLFSENIYQSENIISPFLLGFIKPKIYAPYNLTEQELLHVISHEKAHISRRDYLMKPLAFFILALHWFNPLVWIAYRLFCRDIEIACDEKVIKSMSVDERKTYSKALLTLCVHTNSISACPLAFGEVSVKDRVKKALSYKKPAFWIIIVAIVACIVAALCLLTDPDPNLQEPDNISSDIDTSNVQPINNVRELKGIYLLTDVVYVNPLLSYFPDESIKTYYTFAEDSFSIYTEGNEEVKTYGAPLKEHTVLTTSEFINMFEPDYAPLNESSKESIERITVSDEYSLFIVGSEIWFAEIKDEHIWIMYRLEPSAPYLVNQKSETVQDIKRLTIEELGRIVRDRGNNITWKDFAGLEHYDIGSGFFIWQVPIDDNYCVVINGSSLSSDPMLVWLVRLSPEGEMTSFGLDLLDESVDVNGFFIENFGIETKTHSWVFNPMLSSVFPALAIDVDLRYSTVDVFVDNGSLYLHGDGKTQSLGDTYTYNFGETIYWSPLPEDSYESDKELYSDITALCNMNFSINNGQEDVISTGRIFIEQTGQTDNGVGGYEYRFWLEDNEPTILQLAETSDSNKWYGFVLKLK